MLSLPDSDLPLLETDDFLPPISRWATLGGLSLVGTIGGAVVLAATIQYNVTVQADASVRPMGELSMLQAAAEGTVSGVNVQPNQTVQKGDVIAEINVLDRARLRRLEARKNTLQSYIQQYKTQLTSVGERLQALDAQILAQSGLTVPPPPMSPVYPVQAGQQPSPPDEFVNVALNSLARSLPVAAANLATQRDRLLRQRLELQNQIRYDEETLQEVSAEIGKQVIRAPVDGTILRLEVHHPGQPVRLGDPIVQIVPKDAPLVVKARINTQDISQVTVGQPAQLRVSAYPYPDFGVLKGTVQAIAPDVTTIRDGYGNSFNFYEVTIQPSQPYLTRDNRQYPIQPGMEVRADIISRQETVLQFLLRKARLWVDL